MIKDGRSFLLLIGQTTKEEVLEDGVKAIESLVGDWADQILAVAATRKEQVVAGLYQGALLGLQIAARGRAQAARRLAQDMGIEINKED